jgi:hypothetical protein
MSYKTLVAASLMSIALTSAAFAQCVDCALHPDRDVLNNGAQTPASKMVQPDGAAGASTANSEHGVYNTQHHHYRDANASIGEGSAPADTLAHEMYMKNLRDSGYNPASDFDAAGTVKVH